MAEESLIEYSQYDDFYSTQRFVSRCTKYIDSKCSVRACCESLLLQAKEFECFVEVEHALQVSALTEAFLRELTKYGRFRFNAKHIDAIATGALLHDIGKAVLPKSVFDGTLSASDNLMFYYTKHAEIGAAVIDRLDFFKEENIYKDYAQQIALHHHERIDGQGYPSGWKKNEIPVWLQAVSIVDVYSALMLDTSKRPAYSRDKALALLVSGECGAFDSDLLSIFISLEPTLYEIMNKAQMPESLKSGEPKLSAPIVTNKTTTKSKKRKSHREYFNMLLVMMFIFVLLLSTLVLGTVLKQNQLKKALKDESNERLNDVFEILEFNVDRSFGIIKENSQNVAENIGKEAELSSDKIKNALLFEETRAEVGSFSFVNVSGSGIASDGTEYTADIQEKMLHACLTEGRSGLTGCLNYPVTQEQGVAFVTPVYSDNNIIGAISVFVPSEKASDILVLEFISQNTKVIAISRDGLSVISFYSNTIVTIDDLFAHIVFDSDIEKEDFINDIVSGDSGLYSGKYLDQDFSVKLKPSEEGNWTLAVCMPSEYVMGLSTQVASIIKTSSFHTIGSVLLLFLLLFIWNTFNFYRKAKEAETQKRLVEKLRFTEQRYNIALSNTNDLVFEYDIPTQTSHYESNAFKNYFDSSDSENVPESLIEKEIVHKTSAEAYRDLYRKVREGAPTASAEVLLLNKNGRYVWNSVSLTTLFNDDGEPVRAIGLLRDISEEKLAKERMEQETLYRKNLSQFFSYRMEFDFTADKLIRGKTLTRKFLTSKENMPASKLMELILKHINDDDKEKVKDCLSPEKIHESYERGERGRDLLVRFYDGVKYVWLAVKMAIYRQDDGHLCVLFLFNDVTNQQNETLALKDRLRFDPVTGLLNKVAFRDAVADSFLRAPNSVHALIMIDVDKFKQINDTLGHAKGDERILLLSDILKKNVRSQDSVAHIGGDEFMIFMKSVGSDDVVEKRINKILFEFKMVVPEQEIRCSLSAGIAFYNRHGDSFEELFRHADEAMYAAKKAGGDRFKVFDPVDPLSD